MPSKAERKEKEEKPVRVSWKQEDGRKIETNSWKLPQFDDHVVKKSIKVQVE